MLWSRVKKELKMERVVREARGRSRKYKRIISKARSRK
jgi:hypothetical protein